MTINSDGDFAVVTLYLCAQRRVANGNIRWHRESVLGAGIPYGPRLRESELIPVSAERVGRGTADGPDIDTEIWDPVFCGDRTSATATPVVAEGKRNAVGRIGNVTRVILVGSVAREILAILPCQRIVLPNGNANALRGPRLPLHRVRVAGLQRKTVAISIPQALVVIQGTVRGGVGAVGAEYLDVE